MTHTAHMAQSSPKPSIWATMTGTKPATFFHTLPEVSERAACQRCQDAQVAFASSLNVGDVDVLERTLAEWDRKTVHVGSDLRLRNVASQMILNYTAPSEYQVERGEAKVSSMPDYISTLEHMVALKPENPQFAALLAHGYMEVAEQYQLIERRAVSSDALSHRALELAEQVLLKHNATHPDSRMTASAWYRLQTFFGDNCEAFQNAFVQLLTLDPSDLSAYRTHGAQICGHACDEHERLQNSVDACLRADNTEIGQAGYFLMLSNMLGNSNEALGMINVTLFEKGLGDLVRLSDDPQFELNEAARLISKMARRVKASRSISSRTRRTAFAVQSAVCNRLSADLTALRLDAWGRSRDVAINSLDVLFAS